jgi:hypothetical protein
MRGETMLGFLYENIEGEGIYRMGWDWTDHDIRLRDTDVNYRYTEHIHAWDDEEQTVQHLRALHTRWMLHPALHWVPERVVRYWVQHHRVLPQPYLIDLEDFYWHQFPGFLNEPGIVTREEYFGYPYTAGQNSDYIVNLSELALAFAMGHHRRLGAASIVHTLKPENLILIWRLACTPWHNSPIQFDVNWD